MASPASPPIRVSVVCVTRNQNENVRRALTALAASVNAAEVEVIVVDLASSDGSQSLGIDFPEITYLRLPKNFGWTKAANIGLRSTQAESILFLDPRVTLAPEAIPALLDAVEENGPIAAAVATLFTEQGRPAPYLRPLPTPQALAVAPQPAQDPATSTPVEYPGVLALLIRKSFLKGMNFLDERYGEQWADAEIAAQVHRAQRKIVRVAEAKGVLHPEAPKQINPALLEADWHSGAAVYLGKHHGGGLGHSVRTALGSLFSGKLSTASRMLSGVKIDGSQE